MIYSKDPITDWYWERKSEVASVSETFSGYNPLAAVSAPVWRFLHPRSFKDFFRIDALVQG